MKERLSNLSTSARRMEHYVLAFVGIGLIVASIYDQIIKDHVSAIIFLFFGLLILGIVFFIYKYYSKMKDVFIDDNFIYISKGDENWAEVELDKIKSIKYHSIYSYTESIIPLATIP